MLLTENYLESLDRLPKTGQHILACQQDDQVVVYQAYNYEIADYAVQNQKLGGPHYSYNRMSWIKPNFLWMMYRCGWAAKVNQERVLAIRISKADFEEILRQGVFSSFDPVHYENREHWKQLLNERNVRLQWDPDHDAFGNKLKRRAIQIGMKENVLETFGKTQIRRIEDITEFVKMQKAHVDHGEIEKLLVPFESIYEFIDVSLCTLLGTS